MNSGAISYLLERLIFSNGTIDVMLLAKIWWVNFAEQETTKPRRK